MRLSFLAIVAVTLTGLLAGCQAESSRRVAEARKSSNEDIKGVTTKKALVRPWTTAKAWKTAKLPTGSGPVDLEQALKQTNDTRARANLPALKTTNPILNRVAQEFAEILAKEKRFDAVAGNKIFDRVKEAGYPFLSIGAHNNITREQVSPDTVARMLKDPSVAGPLSTGNFTDIAVGAAPGGDSNNYVVIIYATPMKK